MSAERLTKEREAQASRAQALEYQRQNDELTIRLRAADVMAAVADDWVRRKLIDARSVLADARLDYGDVFSEEEMNRILGRKVVEGG